MRLWLSFAVALTILAVGCAAPAAPTATSAPKPAAPAPAQPKPTAQTAQPTATTAAAKPTPTTAAAKPTPAAAAKPAAAPASGTSTVNVGVTRLMADGPLLIALEKGYFKELGIEIKVGFEGSAADAMVPLAAGQLDVVGGGINVGTFNAIARNLPMKIVADRAYLTPGNDGNFWMLRPGLKDKVTKITDLKGLKFAINSTGSPLNYQAGKAFELFGMTLKDVDVTVIGFPDMGPALANGAIDAGIVVEPFATAFHDKGMAYKWMAVSNFITKPYMDIGVVFYNSDWAAKNDAVAKNFMVALIKGAREYYTAMKNGPNRAEVIKILTTHTTIKDPKQMESVEWTGLNPDGYLDRESIIDQMNWYFDHKMIDTKVPMEKVIDQSYVDFAIGKLGKFKP
ncbi:MAG: ABC transporter substrate-binding protein [Chloroflexi bacterium]|nr:ABC transporter substrate-binding protein [Chloroflexota bacterium]